jgi:hypothetical protein
MLWSRRILVVGVVVVCCWRKKVEVAAEGKYRNISSEQASNFEPHIHCIHWPV